ncbi:LacI family DNA-binding transcriptional regulator [Chakrabartyella piscis]|uniref:LacI family DNA-binding transcriptional regulator n=1 Tax=Chakrabartyella piscis TaxID=2918914 RepID=UPI0029587D14|nr:LacI family DNA-binding transcriptional regulator [Chakrabartyella piscis]
MTQQATIKDVARMSGVSIGTVDRVIHKRGKVSKKNEEAVLRAIDALNYKPSQIARALVKRRYAYTIGVCLPGTENDFWIKSRRGVEAAQSKLTPFGVELIVEYPHTYNFQEQIESLKRLIDKGVNAILLYPFQGVQDQSLIDEIIPKNIPYATVFENCPSPRKLFHYGPDNLSMGKLAGRLAGLYTKNDFNCLVIAPNKRFFETQQRIAGFTALMEENYPNAKILDICDIPMDDEILSYREIYDIAMEKINEYPELDIIYVTNGLTQWAAAAVKNMKLQNKIQVIGFEKTPMTLDFIHEKIICATIDQCPEKQWCDALSIMFEYLMGQKTIASSIINSQCSIVMEENIPFLDTDS